MVEQLGIGTGGLMGRTGRRRSLAILRAAADSGYRHIDTARLYGGGQVERVVGTAARSFGPGVTVATKVGLGPHRAQRVVSLTRTLARPLARAAGTPGRPAPSAPDGDTHGDRGEFSPALVEQSLRVSERELRRQPDHLLLHQVCLEDLTPELVALLLRWKESGRVGGLGTATSHSRTKAVVEAGVLPLDLVQVAGGPLAPPLPAWPVPTSAHSVFGPGGSWLEHFRRHLGETATTPDSLVGLTSRELGEAVIEFASRTGRERVLVLYSSSPDGVRRNAASFGRKSLSESEMQDLRRSIDGYHRQLGLT